MVSFYLDLFILNCEPSFWIVYLCKSDWQESHSHMPLIVTCNNNNIVVLKDADIVDQIVRIKNCWYFVPNSDDDDMPQEIDVSLEMHHEHLHKHAKFIYQIQPSYGSLLCNASTTTMIIVAIISTRKRREDISIAI